MRKRECPNCLKLANEIRRKHGEELLTSFKSEYSESPFLGWKKIECLECGAVFFTKELNTASTGNPLNLEEETIISTGESVEPDDYGEADE